LLIISLSILRLSWTPSPSSHQDLKKSILIVDDEPDMTKISKMALEREGFLIDAFNDPALALENFKPNIYDLAILDVKMPKMMALIYTKS
jgi:DNA-binding response OmpR family regulator